MKLTDLDAELCTWQDVPMPAVPGHPGGNYPRMSRTDDFSQAQGVRFRCACAARHWQVIGFEGRGLLDHQASQARRGGPARWTVNGTGLADLTLGPYIEVDCGRWAVTAGQVMPA